MWNNFWLRSFEWGWARLCRRNDVTCFASDELTAVRANRTGNSSRWTWPNSRCILKSLVWKEGACHVTSQSGHSWPIHEHGTLRIYCTWIAAARVISCGVVWAAQVWHCQRDHDVKVRNLWEAVAGYLTITYYQPGITDVNHDRSWTRADCTTHLPVACPDTATVTCFVHSISRLHSELTVQTDQ